jgi:hypothetical protein
MGIRMQGEGSYVSGFRNLKTVAMLEQDGYAIKATKTSWSTFDPGSDASGIDYCLDITKDGCIVFRADRTGAGRRKDFGIGERHIGTTTTPEGRWTVTHGEMPTEFQFVTEHP